MGKPYTIKWTWFHTDFRGKNRVVQNTVIDHCWDATLIKMWFEDALLTAKERGMKMQKRTDTSATFITLGADYVNVRIEC